jgi:putative redox protein
MITAKRKDNLSAEIIAGNYRIISDVREALGGRDEGPDPHEYLQAALAACTIITVQMYANRKQWKLESTDVKINIVSETKEGTQITREVSFKGDLTQEQILRLQEISTHCPIHHLLEGKVEITDIYV